MPVAQLVWFDTGATTGMAVVGIRPSWLAGGGPPDYEGLARALQLRWVGQAGRDARIWDATGGREKRGRTRPPNGHVVNGAVFMSRRKARAGSDCIGPDLGNIMDVVSECEALLIDWPDAAWGHEDFLLAPSIGHVTADTLSATQVSSAITYAELAYGETARVPFTQSASFAKTTVNDDKLRAANCYYPGMRHANDAMRHCLLFLRQARSKADIRAAAWPRIFRDDGSLKS